MMLEMESGVEGFGVKRPVSGRMICLNAKRCTGKYRKRNGMKGLLRHAGKRYFRGFSADFKPWKERWHFFSGKYYGRWRRGEAYRYSCKRSVLFRSGRERVYLDSRVSGCRSLIDHPACFHPEKHRIYFHVWISEFDNEQEFGIACELDGVYNIDHVAGNWVVCQQDDHGRWNCGECWESGDPQAEPCYVKATFNSRQELLLDHVKPTIEAIRYLCSHDKVSVLLDCPNNPGNSSSAVMLNSDSTSAKNWFLIPVGAVKMPSLNSSASEAGRWIHERLSRELQQAENGDELT